MTAKGTDMQQMVKTFGLGDIKRIDAPTRTIEHAISSKAVDRDGEVLIPSGCRFETYLRQNPVVFWNHLQRDLPIAKCDGIEVSGDLVIAATRFAGSAQMHDKAETIFLLYRDGFLKSWSVGLSPKTVSRDPVTQGQTGRTILEWELLEYSGVGIPSNPDAVVRMCKAAGLPDGATEDDVRKALGTKELAKWWEIALPIAGEPEPETQPIVDKTTVVMEIKVKLTTDEQVGQRKSFMGVQQSGFTTAASGASSPMHVHDYGMYVRTNDDGTVTFEGGCAYGVADHSHRITIESLMKAETEASDGHVHLLMAVEAVREALLAQLTKKDAEPDPGDTKEGRVLSTANFNKISTAHATIASAHAAIGEVLQGAARQPSPEPAASRAGADAEQKSAIEDAELKAWLTELSGVAMP